MSETESAAGGIEDPATWWRKATAVVTGAGQGIGLGIATELARLGAHVVVADIDAGTAEAAASSLRAASGSAKGIACDVSSREQVDALVADTLADRGRLDVLVNNAGISRPNMLWNLTDEQWDAVLATNLSSQFYAIRAAARDWMKDNGGAIVNISSMGGLRGSIGQINYAAAKAGVIGLTKAAALELGRYGVRANAVAPGTTETPMTSTIMTTEKLRDRFSKEIPLGRFGKPSDIASAVAFLAGPSASWITGKVLTVDGGAYN